MKLAESYGPPKKIIINCSQINHPAQIARILDKNHVEKYVYGLYCKMPDSILRHLKWGKGSAGSWHVSDDRIARQIEGASGWGKTYYGTAAQEFRSRLQERINHLPSKDDMFIEVFDFTVQYNKITKDFPNAPYDVAQSFVNYKEAERIHWDVQNKCVGPLNIDIPKFKEGSIERELCHMKNYHSLFEHVVTDGPSSLFV